MLAKFSQNIVKILEREFSLNFLSKFATFKETILFFSRFCDLRETLKVEKIIAEKSILFISCFQY